MFVTCLYAVLEPGHRPLRYANAGHNLPYVRTADGVIEMRATGMPLGLMPDELRGEQATWRPATTCCSTVMGWSRPTTREREMFGFPRVGSP